MIRITLMTMVVSMFFLRVPAVAQDDHPHPHEDQLPDREIKIDKSGQINLPSDMYLQKKLLKKGRYVVRHIVEESLHRFIFTPVAAKGNTTAGGEPIVAVARAFPIRERVKSSFVHAKPNDHDYHIVRIQLAGDGVEYVF